MKNNLTKTKLRSYPKKSVNAATVTASLVIAIAIILPCQAQTSAPSKKRTVWVDPRTGSLLGGGYVDAGDRNDARPTAAAVSAAEKPSFKTALNDLNAQSATVVEGYSLIGPAVSWQTGVSVEILKKQRAA